MPRKMTKEEKEVREWKYAAGVDSRLFTREVTALVRAVREECAKVVEQCGNDELYEAIADAVRKGKPTQQCTWCGLMKENITSSGECISCAGLHL